MVSCHTYCTSLTSRQNICTHLSVLMWSTLRGTYLSNDTSKCQTTRTEKRVPVESGRGESGRESVGDGVPTAKLLLLLLRALWEEEHKQKKIRQRFTQLQTQNKKSQRGKVVYLIFIRATFNADYSCCFVIRQTVINPEVLQEKDVCIR